MDQVDKNQAEWTQTVLLGRKPARTLARILVLVGLSFIVFRFVLLPIRVEGPSMAPNYRDNQINFINRLAFISHSPRRGDVVAIRTTGLSIMYLKRVVALPGEVIAFQNGVVFVNGVPIPEPYLKLPSNWTIPPEVVKPGHYYCVGDNRSMPHHDHEKGQAQRERIVGKVLL